MSKQMMYDALTHYSGQWRKKSLRKTFGFGRTVAAAPTEREDKPVVPAQKFLVVTCSPVATVHQQAEVPASEFAGTTRCEYDNVWWDEMPLAPKTGLQERDYSVYAIREGHQYALGEQMLWNWNFPQLDNESIALYDIFIRAAGSALVGTVKHTPRRIESFGGRLMVSAEPQKLECEIGNIFGIENAAVTASGDFVDRFWNSLRDENESAQKRAYWLHELLIVDTDAAESFLVSEICRDDIRNEWRNALILSAEVTPLHNDDVREKLRPRLYFLAEKLRQSPEANLKPVVQSAIRCYSSLAGPAGATSLLRFLEPPVTVETRLVALQCIVHMFERNPPENSLKTLADRVYELAGKFLDKDWLVSGEKAAIGQNATHALAVLGDERLGECISKARELDMTWVSRQIARKLAQRAVRFRMGICRCYTREVFGSAAIERSTRCAKRLIPFILPRRCSGRTST